ncbi:MAG: CBS domain-containing protein [Candidatus Limnocylindrales bacterium]
MKVREVMTSEVCQVKPETPLREVAQLLVERQVSGVPVVDDAGRVLGVVSEGDFLAREAGESARPSAPLWWTWAAGPDKKAIERMHATTAGTAMTAPAVTVGADRPLSEAAMIMARRQINRLPVVEDGRLVGIISRADIVRAFARTDEELLTIVRDSLRAVDGLRVVSVTDGVAVLAGTLAGEPLARTVQHVTESVEGIVAVDVSGVSWDPDGPDRKLWVEADTEAASRLNR